MYMDEYTEEERRIIRAKFDDFYFENINYETKTAITIGKSGRYTTTLNSCTCKDFQARRKPCKHIYRLTYKLSRFDLYENIEQEEIAIKINKITDLVTAEKLKDIFYRKRNAGNKYYLAKDYQTNFLETIEIIKLSDIPKTEIINDLYKVADLKIILKEKYDIKGLKKNDLIELFASDTELLETLPANNKFKVELLISDNNKNFFIDCLNYRIYNQLQDVNEYEQEYYNDKNISNTKNNETFTIKINTSNELERNKKINSIIIKVILFVVVICLCWPIGLIWAAIHLLKNQKKK